LFLSFDTVFSKYAVKNAGAGTRKGTSTKKTPVKPPTISNREENVTRNFSARGKGEREIFFSPFHHAWNVLHLQFFRPREEEENIQNCVRWKTCCGTNAFSLVTGIFPNNDTAMITKHARETPGGGGGTEQKLCSNCFHNLEG
jgi:hypothetical protein